jgi:hypothetical protein
LSLLEKAGHSSRALKATDRDTLGWKAASLMDKPWFDQESGTWMMLDEYVGQMASCRRIVEDETITEDELDEQIKRVASLLRAL